MKITPLLFAPIIALLLTACGGSGSGGDDPVVAKAVLTVSPASIELIAQSETPVTLTVTNTSNSIAVTAISALLPSSWTDVVQDASGCASLPPQAHCTLSFTPGNASHPLASVDISGHNTETASATIVVSPFNGAVIEALTATVVSMELGQTVTMGVVNNSATVTAINVSARLAGTALAGNVTQDASDCAIVLPGQACHFNISSGNTTVSPTSFSIRGDNTNTIGGSIEIIQPGSAPIAIAGSPLVLQATNGAAVAGTLTITNLSTDVIATNISASFGGTALAGNIIQDASACVTLVPAASCTLTFTPGSTAVAQTSFAIQGDNTSQVGASIAIDAPQTTVSVSGSPLTLFANGPSGALTITNTSSDTATNIVSNFTGTALDGNVTETGNTCTNLAAGNSCTLTYTPGNTGVAQTSFAIAGSNTNTLVASMTVSTLAVGDSYAGGIVFVLPSGSTPGIIVSTVEDFRQWDLVGTSTGATSNTDGAANTDTIVALYGTGTNYAAGYCAGYSVVDGSVTYGDWYLPAIDELGVLMGVSDSEGLAVYSSSPYWSSTEVDATDARYRSYGAGAQVAQRVSNLFIRCARPFTL